jgi:HlyD family secretion protein
LKASTHRINQELFKKDLVSKEEFHAIETELEIAQTAVAQARATLTEARQELMKTKIVTPISGTVTALNVEEGEMAVVGTMNNPGTVLMTISDLARVVAVCEVDESDVIDIELGHSAAVTIDALPDTTFEGRVIEVSSSGTTYRAGSPEEVTNFEVRIELGEPVKGLKPNMSATCEIVTEHRMDVLKVPIQSVIEKKEKEGVFVVEEGKSVWKDVKSGISDEKWVEMKDGVAEDDSVVSGTYKVLSTLKGGERVKASSPPEGERGEKEEKGEEESTAEEAGEEEGESPEGETSTEGNEDEGDAGESH